MNGTMDLDVVDLVEDDGRATRNEESPVELDASLLDDFLRKAFKTGALKQNGKNKQRSSKVAGQERKSK